MSTAVEFEAAEPAIRSASSVGTLVPFIGAGLSRPLCQSWAGFLNMLNQKLGIRSEELESNMDSAVLYQSADKAAFRLRLMPHSERRRCIAEALLAYPRVPIPEQARALAVGFWPLVVTTNYDDVYIAALGDKSLRIRGRSRQDCEQVVRSLNVDHPPQLWCVQGFVGQMVASAETSAIKSANLDELTDQVVIGHQQYQVAASRNPEFRRCFGELYRRRSLIFIGSGLMEAYFVSLLSEIVLNFGPGPHQHYALFSEQELTGSRESRRPQLDTEFFEVRLGILSVRYGDTHGDLPKVLERITPAVGPRAPIVVRPRSMSYELPRSEELGGDGVIELSLRFSDLEDPLDDECVVLSVGLEREHSCLKPVKGRMVESFMRDFTKGNEDERRGANWELLMGRLFQLVHGKKRFPVFALAAREPTSDYADRRSLTAIELATCEALSFIEQSGKFSTVYMGVLAAGDRTFAYPTFPFLAQLRGIRRFALTPTPSKARKLMKIEIRIVDKSIIGPIVSGRLPVQETLASGLVRVLVRVADTSGDRESHTISVNAGQTVREALSRYGLNLDGFKVEPWPLPHPDFKDVLEAPVFPNMTIRVEPCT